MASQEDKSFRSFIERENQHLLAASDAFASDLESPNNIDRESSFDRDAALRKLEAKVAEFERPTWYKSGPFMWFIFASTIAPILIIAILSTVEDHDTPLGLAFALGMVNCVVGCCYLFALSHMKVELMATYEDNVEKQMYTQRMHSEVNNMRKMNGDLKSTSQRLMESNQKTKELVANLQVMNVDNLDSMNESMVKAQNLYKKWAKSLVEKERSMLHTLYDRFEFLDHEAGMTKEEYDAFLESLPDGYKERIKRLGSFQKLSHGDGIIDFSEFKQALDVFAEMDVGGSDIEFEIQRQETGLDENGNKTFTSNIIRTAAAAKNALKSKWWD